MSVTEIEARAVLATWQPVLRLADWDIDVRLVATPWRKSGDIKVDLDDRKAVMLLAAGMPAVDLEEVVVHELLHLRLFGLDRMLGDLLDAVFGDDTGEPRRGFAENRFMTELEATTEDLTKAVLVAAGRTAPFTFRRLEAEIEREIGG
jgi:hypothetical protein